MRKVFIFAIFSAYIYGGLFDFYYIKKAKEYYQNGEYKKSIKMLNSLDDSFEKNYNIAQNYYKMGRYKEALLHYKRAFGEGVDEHNRLHNIGNCYFKLKEYDNAILAYEYALKLKEDKDTKYNLLLAKLAKKKQNENKDNKKKKEQDGKGKKKKDKKSKKDKNIDKKSKQRKLTKKELEELKKLQQKQKLQKRLKSMLNKSLQDKKIPILMYKINKNSPKSNLKPW